MSLMQMSFSGAVMILVILVARAFLINKLPKKVFVLLWETVLLRLLIPFSIPSMFSIYSLVERSGYISELSDAVLVENAIDQVGNVQRNLNVDFVGEVQNTASATVSVLLIWDIVWIAGVILCALFFIVSYLRCYREFRTALPVQNDFVSEWAGEHRLSRPIQIKQSDRISTPLTYGVLHPVILLPKKTNWENRQQLEYILLHEYVHICSFDMVCKMVMIVALCLHWFNPLVWVMYFLLNRDIELACDEGVVRRLGEVSKTNYARTLITMEEKKSNLMPLCNNFSKNAIEERIKAIMRTKKITVGMLIISVVLIISIVMLFATTAKKQEQTVKDEDVTYVTIDEEAFNSDVEVPDVVVDTATQVVSLIYAEMKNDNYSSWRVDPLTYEDLDGMTIQIYLLNYAFEAIDPDKVFLTGGMEMDENGWVVPDYPNSNYLIFKQEGVELTYLTNFWINDSFPGEEIFTEDLRRWLMSEDAKELESNMIAFYTSYFHEDIDTMKQYLSESYEDEIELYADTGYSGQPYIKSMKGLDNQLHASIGDKCNLSLECRFLGDDSLTYLTVIFVKEKEGWKVDFYGLEK